MTVEAWAAHAPAAADRRVTVIGERRRADLSLSADVPVGVLLPEVLRLLGEAPGPHPMARRLVTAAGREIPLGSSLAFAAVLDGAVLRLVKEHERPAAPVVHDVCDAVAGDLPARRWRWGDRSRSWTAAVLALLAALTAALLALATHGVAVVAPWLAGAALLLLAAGVTVLLLGRREPGATLLLLVGGLGLLLIQQLAADRDWEPGQSLAAVTGLLAAALVLLALLTPLGRGGHIGAAVLVVTGCCWLAGGAVLGFTTPAERAQVGSVLVAAAVVTVAVLPRLVLSASGLTRLDDQHAAGRPAGRLQLGTALDATHYGLALATAVTAVSATAGGWFALGDFSGWTAALGGLAAVVLLSRARLYPLAVEVIALLAAGTVLLVLLILSWSRTLTDQQGPVLALSGLAAAAVTLAAVRPAEHLRVRARRLGTLGESLAVVALLPVVVGVFGVYGRLLDTF
jgi:type VII secretion integral membrane protein EccD